MPGQQFGYLFDDIGNRKQTTAGGDFSGSNLRLASYSANNLNQITTRDYPGTNDVIGAALATSAVTVNGQTAWRKGEYFWSTAKTNNASHPQWLGVTVASGGNTNKGNVYVAQSPEQFSYDADGNLTNDGRWAYIWDGENRLIGMTVNTNVGPQYQLTFAYDAKGRRIQKLVATNGVALSTNNFLYDGWNLIAETRPDNSLIRSYVWGTDLSGTSQGAGGVGGLLEISYYGSSTTNCFPAYDGNGNIMALVNAADGTLAANYDYAAFGEPIRITGVMARNNPFRFSTKYADDESDLLYYGYRYYRPSTGTWPSRDPIGANGGLNLYGFIANNPVNSIDELGLCNIKIHCGPVKRLGIVVGWHCGVVAPNGVEYGIGGAGSSGGTSGGPVPPVYPDPTRPYPNPAPPVQAPDKEYPVSCGKCASCDSIQKCIQNYHDTVTPPPYNAFGPNSDTYAHDLLNHCGCSVDPIPQPCYTVQRSPRDGGPYTVCPGPTTTPPGTVAW